MTLTGLNKYHYPGVIIALFVIVLTWLVSHTGPFTILEGTLYDRMVQYNVNQTEVPSQILLIQTPLKNAQAGDDYWLELLNAIESQGPASVAITFLPQQVSETFYKAAVSYGNVVFGRHLIDHPDNDHETVLTALPQAANEIDIRWAINAAPPVSYGITRSQQTVHYAASQSYPGLEFTLAQQAGVVMDENETYVVNFMSGKHRIPKINAERVLAGGVIAELISDKHVLIGFVDDLYLKGIHTPVSDGKHDISLLAFQGYALQTLLTHTTLNKLPAVLNILLLAIIAGFSLLIYQWLGLKAATWVSVTLIIAYTSIAWLTLSLFLIWLPAVEIITLQVLMFFLIYRYKAVQEELGLREILLSSNTELQEKLVPTTFLDSKEHWAQVINLVNQTLDLNRLIFLERIEGDHRLREIRALNCSLDSISEMRRDYERTPYSTAIETNGPVLLDREYLEKVDEEEDQYLVPLLFAGDVLGFWAFGIDPKKAAAVPMFMSRLKDYGQQIAELLYHRQQWQAQHADDSSRVSKYLQVESGSELYKSLNQVNELSQRRMKSLEQVFNGLGTATILYDLFGGLIQVNQRMVDLLKQLSLPVYEMTALDLMTAITDMDNAGARRVLRHIVLEHGSMNIPLSLTEQKNQAMVLNIKPMIFREEDDHSSITGAAAFQLLGVLFELVDVTHYKKLYQLQDTLVDRLNTQIRNDMQSLVIAANLLAQDNLAKPQRARAHTIINDKVHLTVELMKEAQKHLNIDLATAPLECYPIDSQPVIHSAIANVADLAQQQKVGIDTNSHRLIGLVFSEPVALEGIFEAILSLLIEDAVEGSEVKLITQQIDQHVLFHASNTGFGIPNERLQNYIFGDEEISSDEFRKLRAASAVINKWTGELKAASEVGEGMTFTLTLRAFL